MANINLVVAGPIVDQLSAKYGSVVFIKVDIDKCQVAASPSRAILLPATAFCGILTYTPLSGQQGCHASLVRAHVCFLPGRIRPAPLLRSSIIALFTQYS